MLSMLPSQPEVSYNLAVLLRQSGRLCESLPYFKEALEAKPQDGHFWLSYVSALREYGSLIEAAQVLAQGCQHGLSGEAVDALRLQLDKELAQARDIASLVAAKGTLSPSERTAQVKVLINRYGPHPRLLQLLGEALLLQNENEQAFGVLAVAAEGLRDDVNVWNQKALAAARLRRFDSAVEGYLKALLLAPDNVGLLANLGQALTDAKRAKEALPYLERAVAIDPKSVAAAVNYANVLGALNRYAEGIACLKPLIDSGETRSEAVMSYVSLLARGGRASQALEMMQRIPQFPTLKLETDIFLSLMLPPIYDGNAALEAWRTHYVASIERLSGLVDSVEEPASEWGGFYFYLAYQNRNDRPLVEALCAMLRRRVRALNYTAPQVENSLKRKCGERIRIGFISEFFFGHTIGKLYQGLIRHLDRNQFEVTVIHAPGAKQDDFRNLVDRLADRSVSLPASLTDAQRELANLSLDVLFYPDIGMSAFTYFLAFARLAPVQAVSWGHPDTTGLDTVDYFVSAVTIEPDEAETHYTERLVKLSRLPCFYQPAVAPTTIKARADLGLPEEGVLYGCPQSLFKLHPDFDEILAEIVIGDITGHIILIEGLHTAMTEQLRARWAHTA